MKFKDYPYEHPVLEDVQKRLKENEEALINAQDYESFLNAFKEFDQIQRDIQTQHDLAYIRHTIDTGDEFYKAENEYFNEIVPIITENINACSTAVMNSPYKEQLKNDVPETWFELTKCELDVFNPSIIEDLQEENKLESEYQNLVASADIEFDGKHYTLASLESKMSSNDRSVRERAHKAYWGWFADHEKEIGEIYDKMVKVRDRMAKKIGFENFVDMSYRGMQRLDYNKEDVANYRKQVIKDLVPLNNYLYARQAKRQGLDSLKAWDEKVEFPTGSPKPKYDEPELVNRALNMYKELSPETGEFFQFMVDHGLLDLASKPRKAAGGYTEYIPGFKSPFIFANFNETAHDAEVLTHEAGHAFMAYTAQNIFPAKCIWPTMETCEIHSMSMEFFTYPWMKDFFEEDTDKYLYNHLAGATKFIPYGVLVDHFQHEVYAHPEMTPDERMATWRRLEKEYLPHKDYEDIDFLERGGWWMRQLHIFMHPFYYIDYTLAQACALQFWNRLQKKDPKAFEDYLHLCELGGTKPFRSLVKEAGLIVPFDDGCLTEIAANAKNWFENQPEEKYE